jgi:hypothetical protein
LKGFVQSAERMRMPGREKRKRNDQSLRQSAGGETGEKPAGRCKERNQNAPIIRTRRHDRQTVTGCAREAP